MDDGRVHSNGRKDDSRLPVDRLGEATLVGAVLDNCERRLWAFCGSLVRGCFRRDNVKCRSEHMNERFFRGFITGVSSPGGVN